MEKIKDFLANMTLQRLLPSIVVLVVGIVLIKLLLRLLDRSMGKSKLDKSAHPMIHAVVRALLYILLILIVVGQLGVDTSSLVALISVLTLAVSLALQGIFSNMVGGLVLLSTHPFKAGDFVEIAGQSGTISGVGFTYTTLLTPDGITVSIPNSAITSAQIVNYTTQGIRRVERTVSASYDAPVEDVKKALLVAAAQVPIVLADPAPFAGVESYGDSAIVYVLRFWVKADEYWDGFYQVGENISKSFHEAGIQMTYPHINVHMDR